MGIEAPLPLAAFEDAPHDQEEHRHEQDCQQGRGDHPREHAGADGTLAGRTGTGGEEQRQHAQNERHRSHDDGSETQMAGLQHGFDQTLALSLQVLGKFDDQNGVLGRQPDDGDQAHLQVDIIGHAAQSHPGERAEQPQRNHQQHSQRYRPTLVQRGQAEEDCQQ